MSDARCECGAVLDQRMAAWPPFCPRCWRALPDALADAVRGEAAAIMRGERPAELQAAADWLAARERQARELAQRMIGESDL